jgi:hypothetical protein
MEQWYDRDFKRGTEMVQGFASLMSMLGHLDLTKFSNQNSEPGGDSLSTMVLAGVGQVAMTHSALLQNPPPNIQPNKEDIKKLTELYKKLTHEKKLHNLEATCHFLTEMPPNANVPESTRAMLLKDCKASRDRLLARRRDSPGATDT